jgi:[acyl-carrier-protein] S-malonyltransferase
MPDILLFPGQGSQFVGMGKDLFDNSNLAKDCYLKASDILGFDIADISFNGPDESLKLTQYTQPAIFVHSIVVFNILKSRGLTFSGVAGHSLGEFTAFVAAGVLTFEDAVKLVKVRSSEMASAGEKQPGSMAAIIGATDEQMKELCDQEGIVVEANMNAPGQIVISGEVDSVSAAVETAKKLGIRRAIPLNVSGAFHSPLMKPARKQLSDTMNQLKFNPPTVPVYQNVSAKPETDIETIKENILLQLESPVRWVEIIEKMKMDGHKSFFELGPGKVLHGLNRRIFRDSTNVSLGKFEDIINYEF